MKTDVVSLSKYFSLGLRQKPERAGLILDPQGWVPVDELLHGLSAMRPGWTRDILHDVVASNDKRRLELSDDRARTRARQGYSVSADLSTGSL